ncbi:MAG: citrate/2-methylcitrate synthase [Intrasporangium sp.]|uniref:citrate/2-methylcitrate synthase n=1 Tax=Intrasporangium sp. TaxID=1925024 RepID=UPI003F81B561
MSNVDTTARTGASGAITVPPGLAGVIVTDTEIGDVRGDEGYYHYRGRSAVELARTSGFEEVAHLLIVGHLPDAAELRAFRTRIATLRTLPPAVADLLPALCRTTSDSLQILRAALSLWGATTGLRPLFDATEGEKLEAALAALAVTPTILAAAHRIGQGLEPVEPDESLGHVEDYLRMVSGSRPEARDVRAIETYLVSTMDHGFNASTFTARVVASTGADLAACLVSAVGSFSGPKHGGAPSRALEALEEIGTPERAEPWVRERITSGNRIMGFGHAVYRTRDPRSEMLRGIARGYDDPLVDFATQVEDTFERVLAELKPGRELHANVEFYAGVVMRLAGLTPDMFTPTFCVARVVGWVANVLEQSRDPKIIRPAARYVGHLAARAS